MRSIRLVASALIAGLAMTAPIGSRSSAATGATRVRGAAWSRFVSSDYARRVLMQPDGNIIVVGITSENVSSSDTAIARFLPTGGLDPTFGVGGEVETRIAANTSAFDAVLQPDGKIVVAGESCPNSRLKCDAIVVRYDADGSLDATFGTNGVTKAPLPSSNPYPFASIVLQPDGKPVLLITDYAGYRLTRFDPNGTLDTTFGTDGSVDRRRKYVLASDLAIDSNNRLVVSWFGGDNPQNPRLTRYGPDGRIDTTFGNRGTVFVTFIPSYGGARIAVQPDDAIVVTGDGRLDGHQDIAVGRYDDTGTLDSSFGGDGVVDYGAPAYTSATDIAVQPDGKIVLSAGPGTFPTTKRSFLLRYESDGTLDPSFGRSGRTRIPMLLATTLAVQSDGAVVASGWSNVYEVEGDVDFALVRVQPDGTADASFGPNGLSTATFSPHGTGAYGVVAQGNGSIVAAGVRHGDDVAVARYLPSGHLDTSFGDDGRVVTDLGSVEGAFAVAIQPDGKIAVAGHAFNGRDDDVLVLRYRPNGSLDPTFGTGGVVRSDLGADDGAFAVAVQPDGRIVVAGVTDDGTTGRFALVRYLADGSIDSSFGFGGVAITSFVGDAKACGVAIQADGKIVAAGQVMQAGVAHVAVARYRRDGSLDPSFGGDGRVTAAKYMAGQSVALQRNGKILVGGGEIYGMGVARFLAGGSLDRTFGREGVSGVGPGEPQGGEPPAVYSGSYGLAIRGSHIVLGGFYASSYGDQAMFAGQLGLKGHREWRAFSRIGTGEGSHAALTVQPDGRIVAAGFGPYNGPGSGFVLVRYLKDGGLDRSFSADGMVLTPF